MQADITAGSALKYIFGVLEYLMFSTTFLWQFADARSQNKELTVDEAAVSCNISDVSMLMHQ